MAAAADVLHLVSKGITQSLSVFLDTIVICSCTAFSILLGDVYTPRLGEIDGIVLTQQSRASHMGAWSSYPLAASTLLFAFSSIIYSDYLGENAIATLKGGPKMLLLFALPSSGWYFWAVSRLRRSRSSFSRTRRWKFRRRHCPIERM